MASQVNVNALTVVHAGSDGSRLNRPDRFDVDPVHPAGDRRDPVGRQPPPRAVSVADGGARFDRALGRARATPARTSTSRSWSRRSRRSVNAWRVDGHREWFGRRRGGARGSRGAGAPAGARGRRVVAPACRCRRAVRGDRRRRRGAEPPPLASSAPEPRPFTRDVAVEHLDEAAFCRTRLGAALGAPHYTAAEVEQGPEERLRAHLDALVLGGRPVAEQVLVPALDHEDPPIVFAAAWCLLASEDG